MANAVVVQVNLAEVFSLANAGVVMVVQQDLAYSVLALQVVAE